MLRLPLLMVLFLGCLGATPVALAAGPQEAGREGSPVDSQGRLELLSDEFGMADGPLFDGRTLVIPDVKGQQLKRWQPRTGKLTTFLTDCGRISATYFNHDRMYLADNQAGRIAFVDGRQLKTVFDFNPWNQEGGKPYRPNDLVVDSQGGIYVTFTPQNQVAYISPEGEAKVLIEGIETPNGIALSPDERTLYVSSFVPKKVWAYDLEGTGRLVQGREFAQLDAGPERGADGMTIDRAGNVYCTGPDAVWIWDSKGTLLDKIACPTKPINCVFGGPNLRTLYIVGPGGLYQQPMRIGGVSPQSGVITPQPPSAAVPPPSDRPSTAVPPEVRAVLNVPYASYGTRKMLADIMVPADLCSRSSAPALVIVHGGGWHHGDRVKFRALAVELARRGFVTMAIDYRLAEEAPFPAAIEDCFAAVRFLREHPIEYRVDVNHIGAIGGSAGGHLVGLMAAGSDNPRLLGQVGTPATSAAIQAAIVMAGPLQIASGPVAEKSLDLSAFSNARSWMRGSVEQKPDLYHLADVWEQIDDKTCPILFLVGEHDQPERNQPSRDKLAALGIATGVKVYPGAKHGCWNQLPWFDAMVEDMDQYFRQQFSR